MMIVDIVAFYSRTLPPDSEALSLFTETIRMPASRVQQLRSLRLYNPHVDLICVETDPKVRHTTECMRWCHDNCKGGWRVERGATLDRFYFALERDADRFEKLFL